MICNSYYTDDLDNGIQNGEQRKCALFDGENWVEVGRTKYNHFKYGEMVKAVSVDSDNRIWESPIIYGKY